MNNNRIAAIAVRQEDHLVRKVFTDEERDAMRRELFTKQVEVAQLNEKFEVVKLEHKEAVTPIDREAKTLFQDIRNGYRDETITCNLVDDQERGMMEFYDVDGVKVDERRLYPEERQLRLQEKEVV